VWTLEWSATEDWLSAVPSASEESEWRSGVCSYKGRLRTSDVVGLIHSSDGNSQICTLSFV